MKKYQIYLFVQDNCPPCARVKDHLQSLTPEEGKEIHMVNYRTPSGGVDILAEELDVNLTPTLVVTHVEESCEYEDGEEYCTQYEEPVMSMVGGNAIISGLDSTLDTYTYAHEPALGSPA